VQTNQEFLPTKSKYLVITADYLIPVLVLILSLLSWWIVFYTPVFAVKQIDCILDFEPCKNPGVIAEIAKYQGINLLRLDESSIRTRFTSADFTISAVTVIKRLPSSVTIKMESVYPTVAAKVKDTSTWVIFDDRLRVIGTRDVSPNVPVVILPSLTGAIVGARLESDELNTALSLAVELSKHLSGVKTIELLGTDLFLSLGTGQTAVLTTDKDVPSQIRALQAVLAETTILVGVSTIDVRFAQPVLR